MASDVKCSVSSCNYWGKGNRCEADSIHVVNSVGGGGPRMEAGTMGRSEQAGTSAETACKTFKPKGL
ncbi:MAG: DUF1540 domain-containing protein [Bacillota bacterium]